MWPQERDPCRVYNDEKHESGGLLERDVSDTEEKRDSKKMEGFLHKDWIDLEKNPRTISILMRCFILHSNRAVQVIITNKDFGWSVDNPGNGTKCQPGTFPCACVPLSYHIYSSVCGSWNTVDGTIPAPPPIYGALWKNGMMIFSISTGAGFLLSTVCPMCLPHNSTFKTVITSH